MWEISIAAVVGIDHNLLDYNFRINHHYLKLLTGLIIYKYKINEFHAKESAVKISKQWHYVTLPL